MRKRDFLGIENMKFSNKILFNINLTKVPATINTTMYTEIFCFMVDFFQQFCLYGIAICKTIIDLI